MSAAAGAVTARGRRRPARAGTCYQGERLMLLAGAASLLAFSLGALAIAVTFTIGTLIGGHGT